MSSAGELLRRVLRREQVPAALVADTDPVELAEVVECALTCPRVAVELAPSRPVALLPQDVARRRERVPAVLFVQAVANGDASAVGMAGHVDPLEVALLACRALAMGAYRDPKDVLDALVLADRALTLGEP